MRSSKIAHMGCVVIVLASLTFNEAAMAINTSCSSYPANHIYGEQRSRNRTLVISHSIPESCQYVVYTGAMRWGQENVGSTFTWGGYANYTSWSVSGATDEFSETSSNTSSTMFQGSYFQDPNVFAATQRLYDTYWQNSRPNIDYYYRDGDVAINLARLSEFYCGTGSTPSTLRDLQSTALHESGHVWGLWHDECDPATTNSGKSVMWRNGFKGTDGGKRTLKVRDLARAQYVYGVK